MSLKVGKAVIEGVSALLADGTIGFNQALHSLAVDWGFPEFEIDFGPSSMNFILGQFDGPETLFESMDVQLPLLTLDATGSANQNLVKFAAFAGVTGAQIEVHIDWEGTRVNDFTLYTNYVESALYRCLNQQEADFHWQAYGLLYNGAIGVGRTAVRPGGRNWLRTVRAQMNFRIIQ